MRLMSPFLSKLTLTCIIVSLSEFFWTSTSVIVKLDCLFYSVKMLLFYSLFFMFTIWRTNIQTYSWCIFYPTLEINKYTLSCVLFMFYLTFNLYCCMPIFPPFYFLSTSLRRRSKTADTSILRSWNTWFKNMCKP